MIMNSSALFILLIGLLSVEASLFTRLRRQIVVGSEANTNGVGDNVDTSASAHHWKNTDGVVGMNVTSGGSATGNGNTSLQNNANGQVGDTKIDVIGNVESKGQESISNSDITATLTGGNKTVISNQNGKASGVGDTETQVSGQTGMSKGGVFTGSDKTLGTAGATGSLGSQSEVISNSKLTWDSLMVQLVGSSVAEGIGNAQANVDLNAGTPENGVGMNGLVSGVQTGGGNVNAQVNGNANMNGNQHDLTGNMYGKVNGTSGNSSLVGATHLQSNSTSNSSVSAFGDSKIHSDGQSAIDLISETGLDNKTPGANGQITMNGTDQGKKHEMTVQNGLKVKDKNGETLSVGSGAINGNGSENSNASIIVDTKYNQDGEAKIIVNGDGTAISKDGKDSNLNINALANLTNTNGLNNIGAANANGVASGEYSNITGNSFLNVDGTGSNGNAMMEAWGGGIGKSSVQTNTGLQLNEGGVLRNLTVNGGVSASGDKTSVHSQSVVTDYAGEQTLSNYQKATSSSKGSSSASASNFGILKRKKRSNLGVLWNLIF